ncbi:uncharacterized protein LOC135836927 [Planococcus citri]|uniref:uncharacterized protein LOC135836927 n=1 Tax=Planococcus citri TaxID=170843 RepID=UPI0031F88622
MMVFFISLILVSSISLISATEPSSSGKAADFRIVATKAERLAVGRCLRETIEPLYPEEIRKNLSAAEFLGTFCISLSAEGIEKKYQEAQRNKETDVASTSTSEPNTINKEISTCLQNTSDALILYSRYMIYGYSLLDKQRDQHEKQTEESAPSVSLAQSQSEQHDQQHNNMALVPASSQSDATSGNEHSMAIIVANPQPAGSAPVQVADRSTQPETRSDPEQSMALVPFNPPPTGSVSSAGPPNTSKHYDGQNIWEPPRAEDCSEFARFALGLCNSNEFVNFNDLNERMYM